MRVDFPDQTWRGTGSKEYACIEGTWVPHIDARLIFQAHDMPRSTRPHNPDLCAKCMADLLMKMSVNLTKNLTHP